MGFNRKQRRASRKHNLKVITGGKPADAPAAHPNDDDATRFSKSVQALIAVSNRELKLEPLSYCKVLLQLAAAIAMDHGLSSEVEFGQAAEAMFLQELEARAGK